MNNKRKVMPSQTQSVTNERQRIDKLMQMLQQPHSNDRLATVSPKVTQ